MGSSEAPAPTQRRIELERRVTKTGRGRTPSDSASAQAQHHTHRETYLQHQSRDRLGRLVVEGWADVAVHAQGDRDGRVAEAFLHYSRVDAAFEGDGGPRVSEAVEGEALQAIAANSAEELFAYRVGVKPAAIGLVKHETLVVEVGTDQHPLFEHSPAVFTHHGDRALVECDRPTTLSCLRLADHHRAARLDDRLHDTKPTGIEVEVGPTQSERLTSPHAVVASRTHNA